MGTLLDGRVALVTGASRGIGAEIARELAAQGATAIVNYREDESGAGAVVGEIRAAGGSAEPLRCDVSDYAAVSTMAAEIQRLHGGIDVLVNNAGILRDKRFARMSPDDWKSVLGVNLEGVLNVCSAFVSGMVERRFGRIVNISSFVAQAGNFGQTNYATAKAGIIGFTRALALELARSDVTVNAVCPGFIATGMWKSIPDDVRDKLIERIPMRRVGEPSDVASLVRFIVSEGNYITGQVFNVNGGVFIG
jgi:acetoacetyl-CoA reductase